MQSATVAQTKFNKVISVKQMNDLLLVKLIWFYKVAHRITNGTHIKGAIEETAALLISENTLQYTNNLSFYTPTER